MSFLTDFMEHVAEKAVASGNVTLEIAPYQFFINGEDLPYDREYSNLKVDSDGDVILDFVVDKDTLMENLFDEEDMITYLENKGYKVEGEE